MTPGVLCEAEPRTILNLPFKIVRYNVLSL